MRMLPAALLATAASLAACSSSSESSRITGDEARQLLIDRNWLDNMPASDRDHLFVYRFVPNMGGGVFQDRTLFKGTFELFSFEATDAQLRFVLHETRTTATTGYTIEKVAGPAPFDLKLTLAEDPRGPGVYYGIRAETDRSGEKLTSRLAGIAAATGGSGASSGSTTTSKRP